MSLTDFAENQLLTSLLEKNTQLYLGLHTSTPTDSTTGTEVSGGGYKRQLAAFSAPSGGVIRSSGMIQFPTATASWGTVKAFGVFNALTGGNLLWYGIITDSDGAAAQKLVTAGDIFQVPLADLSLSLD